MRFGSGPIVAPDSARGPPQPSVAKVVAAGHDQLHIKFFNSQFAELLVK